MQALLAGGRWQPSRPATYQGLSAALGAEMGAETLSDRPVGLCWAGCGDGMACTCTTGIPCDCGHGTGMHVEAAPASTICASVTSLASSGGIEEWQAPCARLLPD
mmetsp:Transcript_5876/g.17657  ORF Transcript_5876/g.17657 Transcript_5876/m.17657 type:complete len:105 (-) Transcript_5876:17-331(-)